MESDIDTLVLQSIKINFKSCGRITKELDINRHRVQRSLRRLKLRGYLTWIEYSANTKQGKSGIKYLWFEKN